MTLSHLDDRGRARMVDVGHKPDTQRQAIAKGRVWMQPQTLALIQAGGLPKGDVLAVAQVAGVMAAKRTHDLIPMCHPLLLTHVGVEFEPREPGDGDDPSGSPPWLALAGRGASGRSLAAIDITATVRTTGKTGVEMEALTAVAIAGLTIYDMCKAVDRGMQLDAVRLVQKSGGKSGEWEGT